MPRLPAAFVCQLGRKSEQTINGFKVAIQAAVCRRSFIPWIMATPSRRTTPRVSLSTALLSISTRTDPKPSSIEGSLMFPSRARRMKLKIYTNDSRGLAAALSTEYSQTSAVEFRHTPLARKSNDYANEQHKPESAAVKQSLPLQQPGRGFGLELGLY